MSNLLDLVKRSQMKADLPPMNPGDTVRVHVRIVEGNKERIQVFEGTIIGIRRAQNASAVTVRRVTASSIGVERTFLLHSPRIERFEVTRRGRVRRAKLYYLRDRQGKSARIKELRPSQQARTLRAAATLSAAPVAVAAAVAVAVEPQTTVAAAESQTTVAAPLVTNPAPLVVEEAAPVDVAEAPPVEETMPESTPAE